MRRTVAPLLLLGVAMVADGCGSAHLRTGRTYEAYGNLPVAVELYAAGLNESPGDEELRHALIVAQQGEQRLLRRSVDRLVESGRPASAIAKLLQLEDAATVAAKLTLPSEDPRTLENERQRLLGKAIAQLERDLDRRAGRSVADVGDLATCRRLAALKESSGDADSSCARLLRQFKHLALLEADDATHQQTAAALPGIAQEVRRRHPELLEIVSATAGNHTASITLFVGAAQLEEYPYVIVKHEAYRQWVPKLDRKGRQIEEIVTRQPSRKEVAAAKKKGEKPPKAVKVKKKVWEHVAGEYRHFRAARRLSLPYAATLVDLRTQRVVTLVSGQLSAASQSQYHEYRGDPRAKHAVPPSSPLGRGRARPLLPSGKLLTQALGELPQRVVGALLERIE